MSSTGAGTGEQLSLVRARPAAPAARRRPRSSPPSTPWRSCASTSGLAHLDRPFEYAVPEALADDRRPGSAGEVRFAGQDVDGFVLERRAEAEHEGRLAPLRRVVSPEAVLTPALLAPVPGGRRALRRHAG